MQEYSDKKRKTGSEVGDAGMRGDSRPTLNWVEYTKWRQILSIVYRSSRVLIGFVCLLGGCLLPVCAQSQSQSQSPSPSSGLSVPSGANRSGSTLPAGAKNMGTRIIVLETPLVDMASQAESSVRQTVELIMAERQRIRNRKRKRLFPLPAQATGPSGRSKTSSSSGGLPARGTVGSGKRPTVQGAGAAGGAGRPGDTVPAEQRLELAQGLLLPILGERLNERLAVTLVPSSEVLAAMQGLHTTPTALMGRDRRALDLGRRLCGRLNASAILIPRIVRCLVTDGVTRGVRLFVHVQIVSVPDLVVLSPLGTYRTDGANGTDGADARNGTDGTNTTNGTDGINGTNGKGLRAHRPSMIGPALWPAELDVAGAVEVERVLFRNTYRKPQAACIRDAAVQAANLLTHALATGEIAPFMLPEDRLAVVPVLAPTRADRLLFTVSGKRVVPMAVGDLQSNVSVLFTPDVLPFTPDRLLNPGEVMQRLVRVGEGSAEHLILQLWREDGSPDLVRVQTVARELQADYILLTRVTDIEVAQGMRVPSELATTDQLTRIEREPPVKGDGVKSSTPPGSLSSADRGREVISSPKPPYLDAGADRSANVEAVGALVRVRDGRILWQGRATSRTDTSSEISLRPISDASLIRDATRFALIDIQRQLRAYQAHFER